MCAQAGGHRQATLLCRLRSSPSPDLPSRARAANEQSRREIAPGRRERKCSASNRPAPRNSFSASTPSTTLLPPAPPHLAINVERLCLGHRAPPVTGWLWVAADGGRPVHEGYSRIREIACALQDVPAQRQIRRYHSPRCARMPEGPHRGRARGHRNWQGRQIGWAFARQCSHIPWTEGTNSAEIRWQPVNDIKRWLLFLEAVFLLPIHIGLFGCCRWPTVVKRESWSAPSRPLVDCLKDGRADQHRNRH